MKELEGAATIQDPRLIRLRVELFTAMQTLKGEDKRYFEQLISELVQCMDPLPKQLAGLDSGTALKADAPATGSYASELVGTRHRLLEKANQLLEQNQFAEAVTLLDAFARLQ